MISINDDNDYDGVKINDDDECLFNNQHHHCLHEPLKGEEKFDVAKAMRIV